MTTRLFTSYMTFRHLRRGVCAALVAWPSLTFAQSAPPPPLTLTLADAIRMAERTSEVLRIARAATDRATGQQMQARSRLLPQVNGIASYQRAIQLQFEEITKRLGSSDTTSGGGDAAGGAVAGDVEGQPLESGEDRVARPRDVVAEFGPHVQVAAQRHGLWQQTRRLVAEARRVAVLFL
jgi:hypothetical protein